MKTIIGKTLREHRTAVIFAFIIAALVVGPEIIIRMSLSDDFKGIYMHGSDSELMYLARMQQTYNGISAWDNPFIVEYRGEMPLSYMLFAEPLLAYPGKWFGIPVPELNLIYKTIFSGTIFLLIYFFIFRMTGSILWSVVAATGIMGGYRLITLPGILNIIGWKEVYTQFSVYSRPVTAQVSWVIFWSFLHILYSGITSGRTKYFVICGILFGTSFYVYPYNWTFLGALTGTFAVGAFLMKQKKLAARSLVVLCIGAVFSVPYFLNTYAVTHNKYFGAFSVMTEFVNSHEPDLSKIGVVLAVLLFLSVRKHGFQTQNLFFTALIATTFIVTNQQIITGRLMQAGHYHLFFNVPVYILTLVYLAWRESPAFKSSYVRAVLVAAVILSLTNMYLMQSASYKSKYEATKQAQSISGILAWLNVNTPPGSVVLANENLSSYIPVYTHNNVYWNIFTYFYLLPPERYENALFMTMKLNRLLPSSLGGESFFHTQPDAQQLKLVAGTNISEMLSVTVRKIYRDGMLGRYKTFYEQSWDSNLKQFRLDYVVHDLSADAGWNFKGMTYLKPVKTIGNIVVYENILY